MIGRDRELDAGERFLKSIADGATCLVLDGEAGIGKPAIWCELLGSRVAELAAAMAQRPTVRASP
jgi:hypothetical protein